MVLLPVNLQQEQLLANPLLCYATSSYLIWKKICIGNRMGDYLYYVCSDEGNFGNFEWQREISKFKALIMTWTYNIKSFILYKNIYFNGASTSPFAASSVNNKGREKEAITAK